jgi:hypothetical protein
MTTTRNAIPNRRRNPTRAENGKGNRRLPETFSFHN